MPRKIKKINLNRLQKRLENIIDMHSRSLWKECKSGAGLDRDQSAMICNYLKLVKEIKKAEEQSLESLSDEELERIVNGEK